MTYIHLSALYAVLLFTGCHLLITCKKKYHPPKAALFLLLGASLLLRILFAVSNVGFGSDIASFSAWADRMFTVGPSEFYSESYFSDYPPGFMYILYLIGALRSFLSIPNYSGLHLLLLKLPAIICDLLCGVVLYRESMRKSDCQTSLILVTAYLFNPVIILNSSLWGQVDSVFTLLVVCMCLALVRKKLLPAYIFFGIGVLLKPQTLIFAPVLLVGILDYVFLQNFSPKKLLYNVLQGICVLLGMLLLCLPFGLENVLLQYTNTLGSYPYAAVNAYNFWSLLGFNWVSQDTTFLFLSCKSWGYIVILLIVVLTLIMSLHRKDDSTKYPLLGAFIILTMFTFSVRMHERYLYPGLILLLFAYLYKPGKSLFLCYGGFSLLHFYNTAHVLFHYDYANYNAKAPIILLTSAGMVLCIGYFYHTIRLDKMRMPQPLAPMSSDKAAPFSRWDGFLLFVIMALYSCFALYDLGDTKAPVTAYEMKQNESVVLDFGENQHPTTLSYYIAPWQDRRFYLEGRNTTEELWQQLDHITLANVFTWQDIPLTGNSRYLRLTLSDTQASLLEITFTDAQGNLLLPVNASEYPALFDENTLHPEDSSFRNSMYFDEIYHGRTAYEFVQGLQTYETTHPPLGKIFIALGVAVFGMNPFGWRIAGTLFGIAMLPFIYLFGKRMTGNTPAAALCCFLFAFDFMHFVQTRIATIDVFITFFVIAMYYFMYLYYNQSFYDTPLKHTLLPLGACGIAMGLGFACKWTGAYAGIGLAILFFATLFRRFREYLYAKKYPKGTTNGITHSDILQKFIPYTAKTIGFCLIFFVIIPVVIYVLSYLPFVDYAQNGLIERMVQNQTSMFSYHSNLDATHPFSSSWYEWPLMLRPVWYYSNIVAESATMHLREGISAFGNPLVWWAGIPAFLYLCYILIRNWVQKYINEEADNTTKIADMSNDSLKHTGTIVFLITGYLAQYLPWVFVTRISFIYHYFPSVAFVVYMIVYSLLQIKKKVSNRTFIICLSIYGAAVFALFLLFYPVLAGQPIDSTFVDTYLRWMEGWVLVAN